MNTNSKSGEPDYQSYHEQAIVVLGFLGAVMFAGLIFIIQSPTFYNQIGNSTLITASLHITRNWYNGAVEDLLAGISAVSALGCVISSHAVADKSAGLGRKKSRYEFVNFCFNLATAGFISTLILLLLPYSPLGTLVFFVFVLVIGLRYRYTCAIAH
ncbi:MAG: hypothetical protein ABSB53_04665 [Nitrososphaerales archaeon]|jgi:hypothetical protein